MSMMQENLFEEQGTELTTNASNISNDDVYAIFDYWRDVFNKRTSTKLDKKRLERIVWALKRYPIGEIMSAIDGCAASAWHSGQNPKGKKYNDLTLILRNADKLEGFRDDGEQHREAKAGLEEWLQNDK